MVARTDWWRARPIPLKVTARGDASVTVSHGLCLHVMIISLNVRPSLNISKCVYIFGVYRHPQSVTLWHFKIEFVMDRWDDQSTFARALYVTRGIKLRLKPQLYSPGTMPNHHTKLLLKVYTRPMVQCCCWTERRSDLKRYVALPLKKSVDLIGKNVTESVRLEVWYFPFWNLRVGRIR